MHTFNYKFISLIQNILLFFSFVPNSEFKVFNHPRFGIIPCIASKHSIVKVIIKRVILSKLTHFELIQIMFARVVCITIIKKLKI